MRTAAAVPAQRPALKPIHDWVKAYERTWSERFEQLDLVLEDLKGRSKEMASGE